MIEAYKRTLNRTIQEGDEKLLFPIMTWCSGSEYNMSVVSYVNRNFFYIDKSILIKILSLSLIDRKMSNYPKAKKFDTIKYDFVVSLLKKKYFWGPRDISDASKVIENLILEKSELEKLSKTYGLDNKDRKLLGLDLIKFDNSLIIKVKSKSLLDF
jgi:hypothetical protein